MKGGSLPPHERKYRCQVEIATAEVDDAQRFLLLDTVETYLNLEGDEEVKYSELVARSAHGEKVAEMHMTWSEKLEAKAEERGKREGRTGILSFARKLIDRRFGPLPSKIDERLAQLDDRQLEKLGERLIEARSLADLGLDES